MKHVAKVLLINNDNEFLFLKRSDHPTFPNDPDLPGGTVEEGEDLKTAAVREVLEEAGIDLGAERVVRLYEGRDYSTHGTVYSLYVSRLNKNPKVTISWEHASYEWLGREDAVEQAHDAADTYMRMVYDVLTRRNPHLTTWESGRESNLLDDIIEGRKTIEGRLNRAKFSEYRVGDTVSLRRDFRNSDGELQNGEPNAAQVEIMAIRSYPDFLTMVTGEGYTNVIPSASSAQEAANEYNKYYSAEDQAVYGVPAIEVKPL